MGVGVGGVVGVWGSVKAVVVEVLGSSGRGGGGAAFGRVGGYAGDREAAQEMGGYRGEPGGVAGLECGEILVGIRGGVEFAESGEEVVGERLVKGQ